MNIKQTITHNLLNIPGWRTKRHIVVIESDDWGSIRMPSVSTYERLLNRGVKLGKFGFEKLDTIASSDDLEKLFEVCNSFSDINGRPVVITANAVVANPDFHRIKEADYSEYFYEPITATMERYYPNNSPFPLWIEGLNRGVFYPQLHGREHVNVPMWMNSLRKNHPGAREAFDCGVFSFTVEKTIDIREKNTSSYYYLSEPELEFDKQSIIESATMFKDLFGYSSKSFIAPSYKWDEHIEKTLSEVGVKYLQGLLVHYSKGKRCINPIGRRNRYGQIYLNRNVFFECSQNPSYDWIGDALQRIDIAFRWKKPVTICAHRLNFIGALSAKNRDETLVKFKKLLMLIQKTWPDVEFMTSHELGELILNE